MLVTGGSLWWPHISGYGRVSNRCHGCIRRGDRASGIPTPSVKLPDVANRLVNGEVILLAAHGAGATDGVCPLLADVGRASRPGAAAQFHAVTRVV